MLLWLLVVLLILASVGGLPTWGWHSYGWFPSAGAILLIVVVVLLLRGRV